MADLTIYLVPFHRSFVKNNINLDTEILDAFIDQLTQNGEIPPSPDTDAGQPTIWKMTKGGKKTTALGRCTPDPGFSDSEIVYLIAVPA